MMRILSVFLLCVYLSECIRWNELKSSTYDFDDYLSEYGKSYSDPAEYALRKERFYLKLQAIKTHNSDPTKTWKMGINHMTDWTEEEFGRLLGLKKGLLYGGKMQNFETESTKRGAKLELPSDVDWRNQGIVTSVKDQGKCGSCWTFATAQTTESYYALATGLLPTLSEQQILDCTPNPQHCGGTGGCGGGTAELAWTQLNATTGLSSEWTYPYQSYYGTAFDCRPTQITPVAFVSGYINLPVNKQDPIMNHLATVGPLAISVDASTWDSYESGIYNGCNQTNPDLDHNVQLVGYGTDPSLGDYWLVRNSWSPSWGEKGYIRLLRTPSSSISCGVDLTPGDGDGCSNGPKTVEVCGTCGILYDAVYPIIGSTKH